MARPRLDKRLGQHHLTRSEVCAPLVEFLGPGAGPVLEIGPGGGVLTRALLASGHRVVGVEVDPRWAFRLAASSRRDAGLTLVVGDALDLAWEALPAGTLVAGNLPYNVGTAIITRVLRLHHRVPRAGFLVQLEVARRLIAEPGSRTYGSLSVFAAAYSRPRILRRVPPGAFHPPPKVQSAFVGFELRAPPLPEDQMDSFQTLVREGFAQRRKTLRNALGATRGVDWAELVLARAGVPPRSRAEELAVETWVELHRVALEA